MMPKWLVLVIAAIVDLAAAFIIYRSSGSVVTSSRSMRPVAVSTS